MASPRVPITLEHDAHRETRDAIFGEHYEVIPVSTGNYGIDGCRYDIQPMPVRNTKFEPSEGSLAHFCRCRRKISPISCRRIIANAYTLIIIRLRRDGTSHQL